MAMSELKQHKATASKHSIPLLRQAIKAKFCYKKKRRGILMPDFLDLLLHTCHIPSNNTANLAMLDFRVAQDSILTEWHEACRSDPAGRLYKVGLQAHLFRI